ncbi:MAG TPA: sigma-70 family RNA polymerase sigma factor [Candidatus Limnocylindria bacterium]|nr:sigma-70 family RNA polymerase sigma factor [Candidatus Limnocylindria bacterium]
MMRVTRIEGGDGRPGLRVEGRLTRESAQELRRECERMLAAHAALDLDVSGLQFADADGLDELARLERGGVALSNRTPLVGALLGDASDARRGAPASPAAEDAALLARLRAGDETAFEAMVHAHGGRMLATARRMLPGEDDARDVVQEALLSAFRSIGSFEGTARLSTWLHRIVVNAALMKLRGRRRRREESIDDLLPRFAEDGHFAEPVAPWELESETLLARRETRAAVRRAIARLPEPYRTVLVLRDIEELDTEETAVALRLRPNAVKTRLHRARQALRTLLARELGHGASDGGARARTSDPHAA